MYLGTKIQRTPLQNVEEDEVEEDIDEDDNLEEPSEEVDNTEEEEEGEDHEDGLVVSGNDATIAVVEVEEHEEGGDHDDHGMALHVEGVSAGSTSFQLQLMHDGHSDYTSTNNVPVTVN